MHQLPNQALKSVLTELIDGIQMVLKENFLGAYLGGSFAHGGWDAYSDVDFVVVIDRDLLPGEFEPLRVVHAGVFTMECYYARHLEGAYFPKEILGNLNKTDEPLWYLDNGSLNFERSTHDNTLVNRWVLREKGVILAGPDPKTWIPPIPEDLLKAEIHDTMREWGQEILTGAYKLDNRWAQKFAVLSYCRMLQSLVTGEVGSKPAGAAWGKKALDPRWQLLIDDALSARENQYAKYYQPADPDKVQQTLAFIRYALQEAPKLESSSG
ncbi:MAG: aminoglycoside adenylyltransferase domain-containing protein [Brevefilum sp.]